jgi:hypothetical protein
MTIGTYCCGSCAIGSLESIGQHANAEEVFSIFCQSQLGIPDRYTPNKQYAKLITFYIFCAGPETPKEQGGNHHSKDHWPKYGTEFAQFLIDNNLGMVGTLGARENVKHHKGFTAQLWMWAPNQEACESWWTDYQKNGKTVGTANSKNRGF